jgi:putative transposase
MFFQLLRFAWLFVLDLAAASRLTDSEKDLEIMILRQQLRIVERKQQRGPQILRWQKVALVALVVRWKGKATKTHRQLKHSLLLFKPETLLGWHRALARRKWTFQRGRQVGRPAIDSEVEQWIVRMAQENSTLGYDKLEGELRKLGFEVSATPIRTVLLAHGIPPAPERQRHGSSWRTFLKHYQEPMLACDFFTIETAFLKTVHVAFFIHLSTRRVYLAGCTTQPDAAWVTQQARQLVWELDESGLLIRYLIHDHDTKFTRAFDTVFAAQGVEIIHTPLQAPNANAFAERWVRTVREECLDRLLVWNQRHLRRVLIEYIPYYNQRRPHQSLAQQSPIARPVPCRDGSIHYQPILGGILRDYYRQAA